VVARVVGWFLQTFPGRCVERTLELRPFDRALALASRAFVALLPLGLVAQSLSPGARQGGFAQGIIDRFGLEGAGADAVRQLFATPEQVRAGTTVLGLLVLLYSVYSFARLLARMYEDAWHLPRSGLSGATRGIAWVLGLAAYVALLAPLRSAITGHTGTLLRDVVLIATTGAIWLLTPYALLGGRIPFRSLLPTALVTTVAMWIVSAVSAFYVPGSITSAAERYGLAGVSFTFVSWLIGVSVAVLIAAAIGAVAAERWVPPLAAVEEDPAHGDVTARV
jgi:membrane protein